MVILQTYIYLVLQTISEQTINRTTLIGFIGAPWTLGAYCVEGGHSKLCAKMKTMCTEAPDLAHKLLDKLTTELIEYASYQVS